VKRGGKEAGDQKGDEEKIGEKEKKGI